MLEELLRAIEKRYGSFDNVEEFIRKAQVLNYELMRPMFEAFQAHKFKSTGIIQWMLNSAWPEMYWQLYDWYLMPNGAFYGTKTACQPLHLIYNYGDKCIYANNEYNKSFENLNAEISYSIGLSENGSGNVVYDTTNVTMDYNDIDRWQIGLNYKF